MLPDGWICKNINEIGIQVIDGDRGKNYPKDNEFQATGCCLFLSAKNVTKAGFDFSLGQFITNEKHKLLNKGEVKVGDVVITTRGSIGHFAYYNQKKYQTMRINSGMAILRSNVSYIDPAFLYEMCRSQIIKTQIEKASFGSAQPQLTITIIKKFRIPLPPLPEQKKIAAILSTWDRAIEGTEKLLANSQQQKKALMQQLLTGKKRLPGFTGEWKTMRLSDISKLGTGNTAPQEAHYFSETGHDFLRVSDLGASTGRWAPSSRDKITVQAINDHRMSPAPNGATLFTKSGASLLLNQRAQIKSETFIVGHLGYAKAKKGYCDNYLFYILTEIDFSKIASGTSLPALKISDLGKKILHIPPLPEQKAISAVLTTADAEITALESDLARLRQEKKALMQQLLTGKRRVKVD